MKVLYLSCHSILEYDELRMFYDEGIDVFSVGAYKNPSNVGPMRPSLNKPADLDLIQKHDSLWANNYNNGVNINDCGITLTKEFVDNFDIIIVMHIPSWITSQWDVIKHKKVIWRTIGQSTVDVERSLQPYRNRGLKVVRYSPMERNIPDYIGEDCIIRFGKYPIDFLKWNGFNNKQIITIAQSMKQRGDFCGYTHFINATQGLNRKIYGPDNEDVEKDAVGGKINEYKDLLKILSENNVYFNTGTKPASYVLNFVEALMTGIPIVSVGHELSKFLEISLNEIPLLFNNENNGFYSDDIKTLNKYVKQLMDDDSLCKEVSYNSSKLSLKLFDANVIKKEWVSFLKSL